MTPGQISKLPPELRKAAELCNRPVLTVTESDLCILAGTLKPALTWALQVVEERDGTQAKLTKARLGMKWRDDVISSFCDSINDKRLTEKRDEIQWREFDKANDFWEKEERGLELSPYKEQFLIQTDSYEQLENSIHGELDKLGVPRSGGSVIRIRDLHKRAETAEATIATLTRERDNLFLNRGVVIEDFNNSQVKLQSAEAEVTRLRGELEKINTAFGESTEGKV